MTSQLNTKEPEPVTNIVSDETGQFDARFLLWRKFCADHGVPVESLPSTLDQETRDEWDELKNKELA